MFIFQENQDQSGQWIEANADGEVIASQPVSNLSECPKINPSDALAITIPGEKVILATVELPKVRASERVRVASFALEEMLACDPESVYIALGATDATGKTMCAVVDQAYFEAQYNRWVAANLTPRIVVPDYLAIHWMPGTWTIVFHQNMALVRTGLQSGFTVDANNVVFFLKQRLGDEAAEKPTKIIVWQEDNIISLHELESFSIPIETRDATSKNKWDGKGLSSQLNLLQGKYRPRIELSGLQKSWRWCGVVASTWLVFLFSSQFIQWMYLKHVATQLDTHVRMVYQQLFPGSNSILEPHFRTEKLLKRYEKAIHGGPFLKLYRAMGKSLLDYPAVELQSFSFQNNTMQLNVSVKNPAILSQWESGLQSGGITAKQTAVKKEATGVSATVEMANA